MTYDDSSKDRGKWEGSWDGDGVDKGFSLPVPVHDEKKNTLYM